MSYFWEKKFRMGITVKSQLLFANILQVLYRNLKQALSVTLLQQYKIKDYFENNVT